MEKSTIIIHFVKAESAHLLALRPAPGCDLRKKCRVVQLKMLEWFPATSYGRGGQVSWLELVYECYDYWLYSVATVIAPIALLWSLMLLVLFRCS